MAESYNEPGMTKGNSKSYTANPRAPKGGEIEESTGPIASDSLANESIQAGGAFGENSNPAVLGVKGGNSTLANTDTSSARQLDAADDAEARDGDRFTSTSYDNDGFVDNSSDRRGVYNTQRNRADDGDAPTYADNAAGNLRTRADLQPKGDNLVENEGIPPNRSTYTGDVGGPKDPGRLAEAKFNASNATSGGDAGYPKDTGSVDDGSKFDTLDPSESA